MKHNSKFWIGLMIFFISFSMYAQNVVTGNVIDDKGEIVSGAKISVENAGSSTQTDENGNFSIEAPLGSQIILIDFLGNVKAEFLQVVEGSNDLGTIALDTPILGGGTVTVVGKGIIDVETGRSTPIAVSTIKLDEIQAKAGNQEFPDILKNTPSVNVTGQGAGYGDSEIRVRGFDQTNTAYLLNGQPINGMEDGKMYWSNWSGMMDVANAVQVQRGLGASKLAISSVGGTTNIVTKTTDAKQGGSLKFTVGNDGYVKTTGAYSTGLSNGKTGFGATVLMSYWRGDGYMDGTRGDGQVYFVSLGYKPNEAHTFNFLLTGAPQKHDQAFNESINTYLTYGKKHNSNYGFLNGEYNTIRRNYYHKPVANLNWDWTINDKLNLSTVLYASWGRGGGTGSYGDRYSLTADKHVDFDKLYADNLSGAKRTILRASVNNHNWYGMVSNLDYKVNDNWTFNLGFDARYYNGEHYRKAIDFYGLSSYTENGNVNYPGGYVITESDKANPWNALTDDPDHNQRFNFDYEETITYGGVFGQVEYDSEYFSAFAQGAVSNQKHTRTDYYQYLPGNQDAEDVTNTGYNIKGGFNIKPAKGHNVFVNAGYYSRQPFHDNVYLNFSNDVNPLTKNEKILGLEAGYNYESRLFDASVNVYRTKWEDRVATTSAINTTTGLEEFTTSSGLSQLHQGVEFDFVYKLNKLYSLKGFYSYGDWTYDDDAIQRVYDDALNLLSETVTDLKGAEVGGAAQITAGLGLTAKPVSGVTFDIDYRYSNQLYADVVVKDNVKLPSFHLFDIGLGYDYKFKGSGFKSVGVRGNINNLFDTEYIQRISRIGDASNGYYEDSQITQNSQGMFGMGRTYNVALTLKF